MTREADERSGKNPASSGNTGLDNTVALGQIYHNLIYPVKKSEYETLASFRYELRKFLRFSEEAAHEHDLTSLQYQALLAIEGFPGRNQITIGELAEQLQIAAHGAVGLVDRLEAAKFIGREACEQDRRRVLVKLTRLGRVKLEKLARVHREELREAGPLLVRILKRVEAALPA
jgi:DNA-binding MarR family transcriptional regulator